MRRHGPPRTNGSGGVFDAAGNLSVITYVGYGFKVTPSGVVTHIIDASGDGGGNPLSCAGRCAVAVDAAGNQGGRVIGGDPTGSPL